MRPALAALPILLAFAGCGGTETPKAPEGPRLGFPVACRIGETCEVQNYPDRVAGPGAADFLCGPRTYDGHKGLDIRLPDETAIAAGVDVLAAADGRVSRLRDGVQDISIRSPGAPSVAGQECGNGVVVDHGGGWEVQYCHLARGSVKVAVGDQVRAGQPIAQVGLSGATEFPHLHLEVRRDGVVVDPFAPDPYGPECAAQDGLWTAAAADQLKYVAGTVLNRGFAQGPVSRAMLEAGPPPAPDAQAAILTAYVRAIGLEKGDIQTLGLRGPDGRILASDRIAPLDRAKAEYYAYVGKRRPASGWPAGEYTAFYSVERGGQAVISRTWRMTLQGTQTASPLRFPGA